MAAPFRPIESQPTPERDTEEKPVSLAQRAASAPSKPKTGLPCSICHLLEILPTDEADALRVMLGTPENRSDWSATEIWQALNDEGHTVGRQTINRHRGRKCRGFQ